MKRTIATLILVSGTIFFCIILSTLEANASTCTTITNGNVSTTRCSRDFGEIIQDSVRAYNDGVRSYPQPQAPIIVYQAPPAYQYQEPKTLPYRRY